MKISDLINKLEELKKINDDLNISVESENIYLYFDLEIEDVKYRSNPPSYIIVPSR